MTFPPSVDGNERERVEQAMQAFIFTEVECGTAFAALALSAYSDGKRQRNRHNARKAYDTAVYFWNKHPVFELPAQYKLLVRLAKLRRMLVTLGEIF